MSCLFLSTCFSVVNMGREFICYLLYMWENSLFVICVPQCCYTVLCLFKCMLPWNRLDLTIYSKPKYIILYHHNIKCPETIRVCYFLKICSNWVLGESKTDFNSDTKMFALPTLTECQWLWTTFFQTCKIKIKSYWVPTFFTPQTH